MSDPVFLRPAKGLTLTDIAGLTGATVPVRAAERHVSGIAALEQASPSDLTFFDRASRASAACMTDAGACLTTAGLAGQLPSHTAALIVPEPYVAFVAVARTMFPDASRPSSLAPVGAIEGAHIHPAARLEPDVTIEPGAVIGADAEIGCGTVIGANSVIGPGVRIGRDCAIGAGCTILHALIGDRVILHPGCRLGQDGFGFVPGAKAHTRGPYVGRVIVQDDVEIGAGAAIDRGGVGDTVIGEGSKIDNLVQVGDNVAIGRHCLISVQSGIGGSAKLGDFAVLGPSVRVADHVMIGEAAQIAAGSGVHGDVPAEAR